MARPSLPPGFRFHPTDEELLVYYLKKKIAGRRVGEGVIGEIDIYKFEPADLPGLAILRSRDSEWFFFNAQDKKYLHGSRTNRTTKAGYWKATGKDRKISAGSCTGMKKTLIFYFGRAPHGERTDWVMHEFRLDEELEKKMNCIKSFVLCRVRRKGGLGPRNGEQYGAPVLETNKEDEWEDEACVLPSVFPQRVEEGQVLEETPSAATKGDVERTEIREDFDSFLQTIFPYEEQEQQPVEDGLPSLDDLLGLFNSQVEFAMNEPTDALPTNLLDLDSSDMDNLCTLLHPVDNESGILEDMLYLISGQVGVPDYGIGISDSLAFQESFHNGASLAMDDLQNVGFLELADLEEPCHHYGPSLFLESNEGSSFVSDNGVEMPMSTRLAQENLQLQSLCSFGYSESIRALHHHEARGLVNEQLALEVPLVDSSQGLSVVDSRLLTSDDGGGLSGDLPSGFVLSSGQEGVFADISPSSLVPSHSHSSGAYEQSEAQLTNRSGVNRDVEDAVSQEETRVAHGEHAAINNRTIHSVPPHEEPSSSMVSLAPNPSSPSSLARVISEFLGKVNVLPASAAELPVELEKCKSLTKESSISFAAENKTGHSALTNPGSLTISGSSLHFRVKLNPSLDMERIARTPDMELRWSISHAVSDRDSAKPCKSFTNGLSMFLFWITTSALILFCMFRGLCRSTRSAFL